MLEPQRNQERPSLDQQPDSIYVIKYVYAGQHKTDTKTTENREFSRFDGITEKKKNSHFNNGQLIFSIPPIFATYVHSDLLCLGYAF